MPNKLNISRDLTVNGFKTKPSDIKEVTVLEERNSQNQLRVVLHTYKVITNKYAFIIDEELVPNKFGSTAFSSDVRLVIKTHNELPKELQSEDEEDEQTESEDL